MLGNLELTNFRECDWFMYRYIMLSRRQGWPGSRCLGLGFRGYRYVLVDTWVEVPRI